MEKKKMSYVKLSGQKTPKNKTNLANQISTAKLKEMLEKSVSNKIKGHVCDELNKRASFLAKQKQKLKK